MQPGGVGGAANNRAALVDMGRGLAQAGFTVNKAVNSGLLGGFSAFDVRALSEGHQAEMARMRAARAAVQQNAQANAQQQQQLAQQQFLRQTQVCLQNVTLLLSTAFWLEQTAHCRTHACDEGSKQDTNADALVLCNGALLLSYAAFLCARSCSRLTRLRLLLPPRRQVGPAAMPGPTAQARPRPRRPS